MVEWKDTRFLFAALGMILAMIVVTIVRLNIPEESETMMANETRATVGAGGLAKAFPATRVVAPRNPFVKK